MTNYREQHDESETESKNLDKVSVVLLEQKHDKEVFLISVSLSSVWVWTSFPPSLDDWEYSQTLVSLV